MGEEPKRVFRGGVAILGHRRVCWIRDHDSWPWNRVSFGMCTRFEKGDEKISSRSNNRGGQVPRRRCVRGGVEISLHGRVFSKVERGGFEPNKKISARSNDKWGRNGSYQLPRRRWVRGGVAISVHGRVWWKVERGGFEKPNKKISARCNDPWRWTRPNIFFASNRFLGRGTKCGGKD